MGTDIVIKDADFSNMALGNLVFDGNFAFNTKYIPSANTELHLEIKNIKLDESAWILGSRVSEKDNAISILYQNDSDSLRIAVDGLNFLSSSFFNGIKDKENISIDINCKTGDVTINGINIKYNFTDNLSQYPLYIGSCNNNGTIDKAYGKFELIKCIIFENEELIHSYIPIGDELFDSINGEFLEKL